MSKDFFNCLSLRVQKKSLTISREGFLIIQFI